MRIFYINIDLYNDNLILIFKIYKLTVNYKLITWKAMFKNKSPFSHGHGHTQPNTNNPTHNHSRSPVNHATSEHGSNISNVNPMFAQNFANNFNAIGNKGRFNGLPGNLPSNNNSNTSGTMFKKNNPNNF